MPALTGLVFAPAFLGATWLLAQIPPPSAADEAARQKRVPMSARERRAFFVANASVLVPLVVGYVVLTALRDFRDNFAREIWEALGYGDKPAVMTTTEIPVAFGALVAVAAMMLVADNRRALLATHGLLVAGAGLVLGSTLAFRAGLVGPMPWMITVGLGLYMGYVPFNCVLFDRLVATTRTPATAGFLITLADACGYLGSTLLLLTKSLAKPTLPWLSFFTGFALLGAVVCVATFGLSAFVVARKEQVDTAV
jgi:hypothetical protein